MNKFGIQRKRINKIQSSLSNLFGKTSPVLQFKENKASTERLFILDAVLKPY